MVTTTVRTKEEESGGAKQRLPPPQYPTAKTYNYNPNRCQESTCLEQRILVDEKYSHLKYKEKFEYLNRCLNCSTFYPKEVRVCPCCKKGLRFRPKKHNRKKGYDNSSNEIGY